MKLFEDYILRQHKRILAKQSKAKLQAQFKDDMGRWWSTFRDASDFPVSRLAAQQTQMQFLASGLTGKQMDDALSAVLDAWANNKLDVAGAIIQSLRELPKKVFNLHVLVNIIAVSYVRSDEDESVFNEAIHSEKCDWLLGEIERGTFFFERPHLIQLLSQYGISGDQLTSSFYASKAAARSLSSLLDSSRLMTRTSESEKTD
jgi:hypothetical protein